MAALEKSVRHILDDVHVNLSVRCWGKVWHKKTDYWNGRAFLLVDRETKKVFSIEKKKGKKVKVGYVRHVAPLWIPPLHQQIQTNQPRLFLFLYYYYGMR